ncbi:MAG TPA: outer membrane beta-barrel protein [Gallionella sp.]
MKNIAAFILALALVPTLSSAARAVEIAPFTGHRYGGSFEDANTLSGFELADATSFGLLLDFDSEPDKQIEVFLSRQDTQLTTAGTFTGNPLFDLTIDYYHIGGLYMLPADGPILPFVSGTIGVTRMVPKRSDLTTENRLSLSLGGGAKFFLSKSVGLRFDVRAIYTMLNSDTSVFCSGGCTIRVRSNGFVQAEAGAALLMRF